MGKVLVFSCEVVVAADGGEGFGVFQQGSEAVIAAGLDGHGVTPFVVAVMPADVSKHGRAAKDGLETGYNETSRRAPPAPCRP